VRAGILQPSNLSPCWPGFSLLPMLGASAQQAIRQTVLVLHAPGFCWHIIVMLLSEASEVALTPGARQPNSATVSANSFPTTASHLALFPSRSFS